MHYITLFIISTGLASMEKKEDFLELSKKPTPLAISFDGSKYTKELPAIGMAPLGSAAITSSGALGEKGIKHIIHAATGSMTKDGKMHSPSLESVKLSIKNSIRIADHYKIKSVAFPFIGSGIFLSRMGVNKKGLAKSLLKAASSGNAKAVAVAYDDRDFKIFKKAYEELEETEKKKVEVLKGSITDFSLHKSPAIINAANTELVFGGGVSGFIGKASGKSKEINQECRSLIKALTKLN